MDVQTDFAIPHQWSLKAECGERFFRLGEIGPQVGHCLLISVTASLLVLSNVLPKKLLIALDNRIECHRGVVRRKCTSKLPAGRSRLWLFLHRHERRRVVLE